jgi:hypothetical protein
MAKRQVKAIEFRCDACRRVTLQADGSEPPLGYQGQVFVVTEFGGDSAEWFCCLNCPLEAAITNALARSRNPGEDD